MFFKDRNICTLQWDSGTELNNYLTEHKTSPGNRRPCSQQYYFILSHLRYFEFLKLFCHIYCKGRKKRKYTHTKENLWKLNYLNEITSLKFCITLFLESFLINVECPGFHFHGIYWNKIKLSFTKVFLKWSENSVARYFLIACIFWVWIGYMVNDLSLKQDQVIIWSQLCNLSNPNSVSLCFFIIKWL